MSTFLIAGLGNIGEEYAGTRHNIGFDVLDALVLKHQASFTVDRLAAISAFKWKGRTLLCIKPSTYMNLSGKAVKYWMDREKVPAERLLVIVDEIALPLSKLRLRPKGSSAGHNGLQNIQESLGNEIYPRLRFGIGNNYPQGRQVEYVLGKWSPEEWPLVNLKIGKSVELVEDFVTVGIEQTMNQYNKLELTL